MFALSLLLLYSLIIFAASVIGGWLPSLLRMDHTRTQLMMSFVAGLMLGLACYHLLPHAIATFDDAAAVDRAVWWLMIGLLFMFVLLRTFHFHQHDHSTEEKRLHDVNAPALAEPDCSDHQRAVHPLSWVGMALGLSLHTLVDGIALGAAIQVDTIEQASAGLFSIGVFAAIVLHKPLDAMSIATLISAGGWSSRVKWLVNVSFAAMCPLGAVLFLCLAFR